MSRAYGSLNVIVSITVLVMCAAGVSQYARADVANAPATNSADSSASGDARQLQEVVVTAQRRSENLERTPVAIGVVGSKELEERGITTEKDLQAAVPGLLVRAVQNDDQLNYSLRGQSVDPFSGSPPAVLPYVNEVQVSTNAATAFYDLDSVQVLKGPQGTLFGKNTTGGAVLFTTTKPTDEADGYVTTRFGNYGAEQVEGAGNVPTGSDKVLLRLAGFYQHQVGFQNNLYNGSTLGDIDRRAGRLTLVVKPTDTVTNTLVADYLVSGGTNLAPVTYDVYPPGTITPVPSSTLFGPTLDAAVGVPGAWNAYLAAHPGVYAGGLYAYAALQKSRGPYEVDINGAGPRRSEVGTGSNITIFDIGTDTQIKNIIGYTHSIVAYTSDLDGSPYLEHNAYTLDVDRQLSDELQLLGKAFDRRLTYVAGLYVSDELFDTSAKITLLDLTPIISPVHNPEAQAVRTRNYAAYAQGTYDLSDATGIAGLGATLGVRYTEEKDGSQQLPGSSLYNLPVPGAQNSLWTSTHFPSWQAGLQEQLNENLLLYAVSRHSFRSGGWNYYAPPIPGDAASGGARFNPETATDGEIGAKFQGIIGQVPVRANLAAYSEWIDNAQRVVYVAIPSSPLAGVTANVPKAQVEGIEFDGQIKPLSWLSLGASGAYTNAKFTENTVDLFGQSVSFGPYADTPRWSGSVYSEASTLLPNDIGMLTFRADVYAESYFYFGSLNNTIDPGTELPGYTTVNLRLGLNDIAGTGLSAAVAVHNLANRVYFVGGLPLGNVETLTSALPGDPRTYFAEFSYKF